MDGECIDRRYIHTYIVRNILECIGKHSFFHTNAYAIKTFVCIFFLLHFFNLHFLTLKKIYLIINNEYKSMVFTIRRGCLPYSKTFSNTNARMVTYIYQYDIILARVFGPPALSFSFCFFVLFFRFPPFP